MAEFQEVMRQWGRYCCEYLKKSSNDCAGCQLEINGSCNSYAKDNARYAEQIEKHVMAWAAEHPEPVYPTWMEYIMDVQPDCVKAYNSGNDALWKWMWTTPIPADKAQELGIEPKEG